MAISRLHTWSAGEVLLASDLNAEYNNILNNAADLVSPFTKAISMGGFALNFDAANTIALTATTSGISLTGGTLREPSEDTLTANGGGGQAGATALAVAKKFHRISVCALAGDSVKLPTSTVGQAHFIRNDGASAAQVFGTSPDTINSVATATGVPHPAGGGIWYVCTTAGNWTTGPLVSVSGNFAVTFTATAATSVTLPVSGTLATLAGSEVLTNKTITGGTMTQVPISLTSKSVSYTTVLADGGTGVLHPTADNNPRTFTIDSNANVAYPTGTTITFVNQINTVTIAITTDTMTLMGAGTTGSRTLAANGIATALKVAATSWVISGTNLT